MLVKTLTNERYRVLDFLYSIRSDRNIVYITQQEVADKLKLSRPTVNQIFKCLKEENLIVQDEEHIGRYILTALALTVVEKIRNIEV